MLLVTKKGLQITNLELKDFTRIGIDVFFLDDEITELEVVSELAGISKGEARRKIKEGAVWLGDEKVTNPDGLISKGNATITLFVGKEFKGLVV